MNKRWGINNEKKTKCGNEGELEQRMRRIVKNKAGKRA